jgi:hypothetical protein
MIKKRAIKGVLRKKCSEVEAEFDDACSEELETAQLELIREMREEQSGRRRTGGLNVAGLMNATRNRRDARGDFFSVKNLDCSASNVAYRTSDTR